ncbi:hypothetical protein APF79_07365 [bacterium BRH_c32]|nr:MAG: hypothetical protein APF79_07365 [bacterium BRH_c32]
MNKWIGKMKLKTFLFLFVFGIIINGQSLSLIDSDRIQGAIEKSDKYLEEFGLYDGYLFPLLRGEVGYFTVSSNIIKPNLVLIDPEGKVYIKTNNKENAYATINFESGITGEWVLYVIADKNNLGEYNLNYGIADIRNLNIANKNDCDLLIGIVAHANNYFLLFDYAMTSTELKNNNISFIPADSEVIKKYTDLSKEKGYNLFSTLKDDIKNCFLRNEKGFRIIEEKNDFISCASDKVIISLSRIQKTDKANEIILNVKLNN